MKYPPCLWSARCKYSPVYIMKRTDIGVRKPVVGVYRIEYPVCKPHSDIYERTSIPFEVFSIISLFPFNHRNLIDERTKFDNFIGLNPDNNRPT